jgi:AcrR family transcriptional regulator
MRDARSHLRLPEDQLLDRLSEVFQLHGYQGASLTLLAEAGGLQRASLYHRFPGGKEEMAEVILERAARWLSLHALEPLRQEGPPPERVRRMTAKLAEFYEGGRRSCLLDTLSLGSEGSPFRDQVAAAMKSWMVAMAAVAQDAGVPPEEAARRAEEALAQIQGGLVVARGIRDPAAFHHALERLPRLLTGSAG